MDPAAADRLKREWTGRRVAIRDDAPAVRRFAGRTGIVVTTNMNGKALVRFDGLADIGWYDLDPADLRVLSAPDLEAAKRADFVEHPQKPSVAAPPPEADMPPPGPMPPAKPGEPSPAPRRLSPLELARQQGAAKRT